MAIKTNLWQLHGTTSFGDLVRQVRTGRIGREIKEIGAESNERRRVQGVINHIATNGEKNVFGAEGGKKMKGEDKKRRK